MTLKDSTRHTVISNSHNLFNYLIHKLSPE